MAQHHRYIFNVDGKKYQDYTEGSYSTTDLITAVNKILKLTPDSFRHLVEYKEPQAFILGRCVSNVQAIDTFIFGNRRNMTVYSKLRVDFDLTESSVMLLFETFGMLKTYASILLEHMRNDSYNAYFTDTHEYSLDMWLAVIEDWYYLITQIKYDIERTKAINSAK